MTHQISMILSVFDSELETASWTPRLDHSYTNALRFSRRHMWQNLHMAHFPDTKSRHWQWFNFNHAFQIISICCDAASGAIDLSSVLQLKTLATSMLQVEESNDWTISWSKTGPAQRQQREFQNEMLFENQHGVDTAGLFSHVSTLLGRHGYSTVLFPPGKQVTFECMNFCIWYFGFKSEQF